MWFKHVLLYLSITAYVACGRQILEHKDIVVRQASSSVSVFPSLTTGGPQSSSSATASSQSASLRASGTSTSQAPSSTQQNGNQPTSTNAPLSSSIAPNSNSTTTSSIPDAINPTVTSPPTLAPTNSTSNGTNATQSNALPLQPRITPALSVGGVILILTGIVYLIIGVKNRWVHVFLSTAYLTSTAILVLILYVLNPPVSNAIQGAYFIAIFLSGLIFGAGALIFKEVTEGLGCLLGGFALAMWFLTLKAGGLITSAGGKGVFIGVFCIVCWSFSFSHWTRTYALIGSTSFAGATAFVLGVDCFSKAGLKEFWIYIWGLNSNLFPLNTSTFPQTRGIRVEIVIIILGTIIGVISQIKLWKVVKDRQKERDAAKTEEARRQEVVEEVLGRHLEKQNDRDRAEWEKRYGSRLHAKRSTVLWQDAHADTKHLESASTTEIGSSNNSDTTDSVELVDMEAQKVSGPLRSAAKNKRISNISVIEPIEEEDESSRPGSRILKRLNQGRDSPGEEKLASTPELEEKNAHHTPESLLSRSLKPSSDKPRDLGDRSRLAPNNNTLRKPRSIPSSLNDLKRRSMQSLRGFGSNEHAVDSPRSGKFAQSQEALIEGPEAAFSHSRASSIAATMDEENEKRNTIIIDDHINAGHDFRRVPPQIVIHPSGRPDVPPTPSPRLPPSPSSMNFEEDPEALIRPPAAYVSSLDPGHATRSDSTSKTGDGQNAEVLTKDLLARVPSQLSNIVLSYRTNEWAKHITSADAPVFEEPEPTSGNDAEEPVHLAEPTLTPDQISTPVSEKPPSLPTPVTSVIPSSSGLKANPKRQSTDSHVAISPITEVAEAPTPTSSASSQPVEIAQPSSGVSSKRSSYRRSMTDLASLPQAQPSHPKKQARRISNPIQRQSTLPTTIDENTVQNFYKPQRSPSNLIQHPGLTYRDSHDSPKSHQNQSQLPFSGHSMPNLLIRKESQKSNYGAYNTSTPNIMNQPLQRNNLPSETRLNQYSTSTSHQPLKRQDTSSSQTADSRREAMLATWRRDLSASPTPHQAFPQQVFASTTMPRSISMPVNVNMNMNTNGRGIADQQHQQMIWQRQLEAAERERMVMQRAQQQAYLDQQMRMGVGNDAHRDVLRRMQSKANETLKK